MFQGCFKVEGWSQYHEIGSFKQLNIFPLTAKDKTVDGCTFDTLLSNYDASGFAAHLILRFQRGLGLLTLTPFHRTNTH